MSDEAKNRVQPGQAPKVQLSRERLFELTQCADIETMGVGALTTLLADEPGVGKFAPDQLVATDPRDLTSVVYSSKRAKRPHDNQGTTVAPAVDSGENCPICLGNTTFVVDRAALKEGFTFINKNMFPCFYVDGPEDAPSVTAKQPATPSSQGGVFGHHYLQWTSSVHNSDWHNMDGDDLEVVLSRLGALEKTVLCDPHSRMSDTGAWHGGHKTRGFVTIIKNYGAKVGGSLQHGHQQITLSNVMAKGAHNNHQFERRHKVRFNDYMLTYNPAALTVFDNEHVRLVVPYFMRRPLYCMLLIKQENVRFLGDLAPGTRLALASAIGRTCGAFHNLLPRLGREVAYNVLFHTGPGAGAYVEFLPFTQEVGGMEQAGLWVCQGTPGQSADQLKTYFNQLEAKA